MEIFDRLYTLHHILQDSRYPVSKNRLLDELECSESTLYRLIDRMRHQFAAPIENSPNQGYYYNRQQAFELPGLWFTTNEIQALAALHGILQQMDPGLLNEQLEPLSHKVRNLLDHAAPQAAPGNSLSQRLRLLSHCQRQSPNKAFAPVTKALAHRKRLYIAYHSRSHNQATDRTISPQRLVRYRDNWYLDCWCHSRQDLRTLALERICACQPLSETAVDIDKQTLDAHFGDAYGIFAGKPQHTAVLRFTTERARWVAEESWHPQQQSRWLADGRYELHIPYADARELMGDILWHGSQVEVMEPQELRQAIRKEIEKMRKSYA